MVSKARLDLPDPLRAGDDHQLVARQVDVDALEVVLAGTAYGDMREAHGAGHRENGAGARGAPLVAEMPHRSTDGANGARGSSACHNPPSEGAPDPDRPPTPAPTHARHGARPMRTLKHAALKQLLAASVATLSLSTVLAVPAAAQQITSGIEGTVTDDAGNAARRRAGDGDRHAHQSDAHADRRRGRQLPGRRPDHGRPLLRHRRPGRVRGPDGQRRLHQPAGQHGAVVPS